MNSHINYAQHLPYPENLIFGKMSRYGMREVRIAVEFTLGTDILR